MIKKVVYILFITMLTTLCCSCSISEKSLSINENLQNSNVFDENIKVSIPSVKQPNCFKIGDIVEEPILNTLTDTFISYKIINAKIFDSFLEANINEENMLLSEEFLNDYSNFDNKYDFLLIELDVSCSQKNEEDDFQPNISRLSSIGRINDSGIYEPISNAERVYFSQSNTENTQNEENYFFYDINEGETIRVYCGWIIPCNTELSDLVLQIGQSTTDSDGFYNNKNTFYVSLFD